MREDRQKKEACLCVCLRFFRFSELVNQTELRVHTKTRDAFLREKNTTIVYSLRRDWGRSLRPNGGGCHILEQEV